MDERLTRRKIKSPPAEKRTAQAKSVLTERAQERDRTSNELQDATRQLREGEQLSRSIVETIVDAVIAFDDDGVVLLFNPSAEKMFRYR
jgi:PAS domain-containing protein